MAVTLNASLADGLITSGDTTGNLNIQSNGATVLGVTSAGAAVTGTLSASDTISVGANKRVLFGPSGYEAGIKYNTTGELQIAPRTGEALTITNGQDGAERLRIDSSGNVGIGTASPSSYGKLTSYTSTSGSAAAAPTLLTVVNNGNSYTAKIKLTDGTTSDSFITHTGGNSLATQLLGFGNGTPNQINIDGSGNFLVGKTTVDATTKGMYIQMSGGGQTGCQAVADSPLSLNRLTNDGSIVEIRRDGTLRGSISISGATTSYNTSSDYRLKDNVAPMTGALTKVALLKPVTYSWKDDGSVGEGFIAHELQSVIPQAVHGEKDAVNEDGSIKPQGIDTSHLVATLTAAIQELKAIVDTQTARIAALETK